MTPFTVFDTATGEVLYSGTADDLGPLEAPGASVVPEMAPPGTYRDGSVWKLRPPRPSANHRWNWTAKQWDDPRTGDQKWDQVRAQRERVFATTVDRISAVRWDDMTAKERQAWKDYRQALRDITKQPDPDHIAWPQPPT